MFDPMTYSTIESFFLNVVLVQVTVIVICVCQYSQYLVNTVDSNGLVL